MTTKAKHVLVVAGQEVLAKIDLLKEAVVESEKQALQLGEWRVECNAFKKAAEKERKLNADPAYAAWKDINALWKQRKNPFEKAVALIDGKLREWEQKQLQVAAEAEARAQEAARAALEAKAQGDEEAATEAFAEAQEAISVAAQPVSKAEGLQRRESWQAKVVDMSAFLTFLAKNPTLQSFVEPNRSELDKVARTIRVEGPVESLPGIVIEKYTTFAS